MYSLFNKQVTCHIQYVQIRTSVSIVLSVSYIYSTCSMHAVYFFVTVYTIVHVSFKIIKIINAQLQKTTFTRKFCPSQHIYFVLIIISPIYEHHFMVGYGGGVVNCCTKSPSFLTLLKLSSSTRSGISLKT